MKLFLESAKELRIGRIPARNDLSELTFIALDTETTGIHGYGRHRSPHPQFRAADFSALRERFMKQGKTAEQADAIVKKIKATPVQVVEAAAIAFDSSGKKLGKFHEYVSMNDETLVDPRTLDINKWNSDKREKARPAAEVFRELKRFIRGFKNPIIICHNAPFDISLIKLHSEREGVSSVLSNIPFIDTRKVEHLKRFIRDVDWPMKTNRNGEPISDNTMAALVKAFGITNEDAHTAIADTEALMKLFMSFLRKLKN